MKRLLLVLVLAGCQSAPKPAPPPPVKPPPAKSHRVMILEGSPRGDYLEIRRLIAHLKDWSHQVFIETPDGSTQWESDTGPAKSGPYGSPALGDKDLIIIGDIDPRKIGEPGPFVDYVRAGGTLVLVAGTRHNPKSYQTSAWSRLLPAQVFSEWNRRPPVLFSVTAAGETHKVCKLAEKNRDAWNELGGMLWFVRAERVKMEATVLAEIEFDAAKDSRVKEPLITLMPMGLGNILYLSSDELTHVKSMITGRLIHKDIWTNIFQWAKK
jgi:hypothetical protein